MFLDFCGVDSSNQAPMHWTSFGTLWYATCYKAIFPNGRVTTKNRAADKEGILVDSMI